MKFNLPKSSPVVRDADLPPSDAGNINAKVKDGIRIYLHENCKSQLAKNWETPSEQQLRDLVAPNAKSWGYDPKHDPEDMVLIEIPIDDYAVNFLKAYAAKHETTIEHALIIFYLYDETFTERYGHAQAEIDP